MTTRDVLANLDVFAQCPADALDALAGLARVGTLEPDEILFEEGDPATAAFVIASGAVRISKAVLVESDRTLAVLRTGTFFGEAGVIDASPRSATATALETCEIVALPADPMRLWIATHPQAGVTVLNHLGRQMMQRLRATNEFLKETVSWGLEVSGASLLGLDELISQRATLQVGLGSGRSIAGRLARLDREEDGRIRLWLADLDGHVHLVPYHAVETIQADVDLEALHRAAAAPKEG